MLWVDRSNLVLKPHCWIELIKACKFCAKGGVLCFELLGFSL